MYCLSITFRMIKTTNDWMRANGSQIIQNRITTFKKTFRHSEAKSGNGICESEVWIVWRMTFRRHEHFFSTLFCHKEWSSFSFFPSILFCSIANENSLELICSCGRFLDVLFYGFFFLSSIQHNSFYFSLEKLSSILLWTCTLSHGL